MHQLYSQYLWRFGFLLLFGCGYFVSHAQVEKQRANHWYFGNQYGFDFSTGSAQVNEQSAMFTYESSVTMSDKTGALLFYSNGGGRVDSTVLGYIWNRNHEVMEGGTIGAFAGGGYSAAQGALSFQKPGNPNLYYLFTIDELETFNNPHNPFPLGKGLSYFEIDMAANGGLGRVSLSNQKLMTPAFEHMSATKHDNCTDYWLIARTGYEYIDVNPDPRDSFYVFKIDENGVSSPLITPIPEGVDCSDWEYGLIRFAPDGQHFICGNYLFDFDKNTGAIGTFINLETEVGLRPIFPLAFSSDGKLLYYFSVAFEVTANASQLSCLQYDLTTQELLLVKAITFEEENAPVSALLGTPQLAPDGRLYLPFHHGIVDEPTRIYAVDFPNAKGAAAQFHGPILSLSPPQADIFLRFGTFTDHLFYVAPPTFTDLDLPDVFNEDCENVNPITISSPAGFDCQLWSTGDTSSTIQVNEEGLYWLEVSNGCAIGRDSFEVVYENNLFEIELGQDSLLCEGEELLLVAEVLEGASYLWQDSSDLPFIYADTAGTYTVEVRLGNCSEQDQIEISYLNLPRVDIGVDTTICEESELILNARGPTNETFEWHDGSTDPDFLVAGIGFYGVTTTNSCGSASDELFINLIDCEECDRDFPNIFSPNGDGLSENFGIVSNCDFSKFRLKIFNRWGKIVFEGDQASTTWDGTQAGKALPSDVYLYLLDYETINPLGEKAQGRLQGDVTLLR